MYLLCVVNSKRMLYAYAIPYWREKIVAIGHNYNLSTIFSVEKSRNPHDE
jgi:hypothetical protein